jgi:hypothetical protein
MPSSGSDRWILTLGLLFFLLSGWMLFFYPFGSEWDGSSPVVASVHTDGKIRRRHAQTLQWEDLTDQEPIYLRDSVYVPSGSSADVTLKDGKTVSLAPDSLVQFDDITISAMEISLWDKLKQQEKAFRLMPLPKPPKAGDLTDTFGLRLQYEDLRQRLSAILTKAMALGSAKSIAPYHFSLNRLDDYNIELLAPFNGQHIALNGERWMRMAWSPIPLIGTTYELLMSRDPNFRQKIPHQTQSTSVNVQFQDPGRYFWRVRVKRGNETVISDVHEFDMVLPVGSGAAPKRAPAAGTGKK